MAKKSPIGEGAAAAAADAGPADVVGDAAGAVAAAEAAAGPGAVAVGARSELFLGKVSGRLKCGRANKRGALGNCVNRIAQPLAVLDAGTTALARPSD